MTKKVIDISEHMPLRPYQRDIMKAFDNGVREIVLKWSRRSGKTVLAWRLLVREAMRISGTYWYCFNNYTTAHNDIWIAQTASGMRFLDMIPQSMVVRTNVNDHEIELTNGSIIKLIGIENSDKLVGVGVRGIVFDEYAVINPHSVDYLMPTLGDTNGWVIRISTPRGKNHFYEAYQFAKNHPEFALADTRHCGMPEVAQYMDPGFLERRRLEIISKYGNDALYQQEYLTSWTTPNSGSVFGALMNILRDSGRLTAVPRPTVDKQIYAAWDLGNSDSTSIVFFYVDEIGSPRVFDHIENRNESAEWYVDEMKHRGLLERVSVHFLPHDAAYHKGAYNETYQQVLDTLGVRNTVVLNKPGRIADKLGYLRRLFSGMKIDSSLTRIVECLDKLEYEWDAKNNIWSKTPTHKGGFSDCVDSLCYMAQAITKYELTEATPFRLTDAIEKGGQDDIAKIIEAQARALFEPDNVYNNSVIRI